MFDSNTLAQLTEQMDGQPYPFDQIPAEVAERRLSAARQLVLAFATLFAVAVVETNSFEPGERGNYQGEAPLQNTLTALHEVVMATLASTLLQARISELQPENALQGFELFAGPVFAEVHAEAHAEIKEAVETRTGSTVTELSEQVREYERVQEQAAAASAIGLGAEA